MAAVRGIPRTFDEAQERVERAPIFPGYLAPPQTPGPFVYRYCKWLGAGGFGDVFLVQHAENRQLFAAKVLPFTDGPVRDAAARDKDANDEINFAKQWRDAPPPAGSVEANAPTSGPHTEARISTSAAAPAAAAAAPAGGLAGRRAARQQHAVAKEKVESELQMLMRVSNHFAVTQFYGSYKNATHIALFMEYCDCNSIHFMHHDMRKQGRPMAQRDVEWIMLQLTIGVHHMHRLGVQHRDLKPANVLMASPGFVRICDFGYAKVTYSAAMLGTTCGTYAYMAPEMFSQKGYDHKVDVWSLGCILYELMVGQSPFQHANAVDFIHARRAVLTNNYALLHQADQLPFSHDMQAVCNWMLTPDPAARPSALEVLQTPFFRGLLTEFPNVLCNMGISKDLWQKISQNLVDDGIMTPQYSLVRYDGLRPCPALPPDAVTAAAISQRELAPGAAPVLPFYDPRDGDIADPGSVGLELMDTQCSGAGGSHPASSGSREEGRVAVVAAAE